MQGSTPPRTLKKPSRVCSPVRNSWSAGSMSLVSRVAASASVREMRTVGTPSTSAARRAALSVPTNCAVGTRTLPPRWPHFFSDASWSSKWTPAAPASIIPFISSNELRLPPKPASASATIGTNQSRVDLTLRLLDLVGAHERPVQASHERRHAVRRVERLVGIGVAREVGVARDLPAGDVDALRAGLDHLHGLRTRKGAQGRQVLLGVEQIPQALRATPGQGVLDRDATRGASRPPQPSSHDGSRPTSCRCPCRCRSLHSPSVDVLVGRERQELDEVVAQRHPFEDLSCLCKPSALARLLGDDAAHLLRREPAGVHPLPDL